MSNTENDIPEGMTEEEFNNQPVLERIGDLDLESLTPDDLRKVAEAFRAFSQTFLGIALAALESSKKAAALCVSLAEAFEQSTNDNKTTNDTPKDDESDGPDESDNAND